MRVLLRYLGGRRVVAAWASLLLTILVRCLLSERPAGFDGWSYPAQRAAAHLVAGFWELAFSAWLLLALEPLRFWIPLRWIHCFTPAVWVISMAIGGGGVLRCVKACGAIAATPTDSLPSILSAVFWAAVVPLAIGSVPLMWIEASERLQTVRWLQNWLTTGQGGRASWIAGYDLHDIVQDIPEEL